LVDKYEKLLVALMVDNLVPSVSERVFLKTEMYVELLAALMVGYLIH
jgi:hypothetical protein